MKQRHSLITATLVLAASILFLWMFFAAATLERTADLGGISAPPGQDARALAYEFAARWRHGMAGNSPLYMPGFYATAIALWFWCAGRSIPRMLGEGVILISVASVCAVLLAPFTAPGILTDFVAQKGVTAAHAAPTGTWVSIAQGVYSLLTWSTLIIAARFSIKLRSFKPLLIPLALNLVLAVVRPWTVGDFTSLWMRQTLDGETVALRSFLLIPIIAVFIAWAELRSPRKRRGTSRAATL